MKSVYSILITVLMAFVIFAGINSIGQHANSLGNLDNESVNTLAVYNDNFQPLNTSLVANESMNFNYQDEPDVSGYDEFFRSFRFLIDAANTFRAGLYLLVNIPNIILASIPFIPLASLSIYTAVIGWLISITILIALFNAWNGEVDK